MNCQNPKCRSPKSRVKKSFDDADEVKRWRVCQKCGTSWTSDEHPNPKSVVIPGGQIDPPPKRLLLPMGTNGQDLGGSDQKRDASVHVGGVGGGSDLVLSGSGSDPIRPPEQTGYRFNHLATTTPAFLAVYRRYPNQVGKNVASQVFRQIAEIYPGGEVALSAAILAAFDRGMLKRRPYWSDADGVKYCPALERFLERRLWEDEIPVGDEPGTSGSRKVPEYG